MRGRLIYTGEGSEVGLEQYRTTLISYGTAVVIAADPKTLFKACHYGSHFSLTRFLSRYLLSLQVKSLHCNNKCVTSNSKNHSIAGLREAKLLIFCAELGKGICGGLVPFRTEMGTEEK
jgi:hypothetical protein